MSSSLPQKSPHGSYSSLRQTSASNLSLSRASSQQRLSQPRLDDNRKTENVTVSVRVRPLSENELKDSQQHIWDSLPGDAGKVTLNELWKDRLRKTNSNVEYQYDQVFVGSDNEGLYVSSVADVVQSAMQGYNGTVFAYGQTSSGKTFSMMGYDDNPGVIPLAIEDVFEYISETREQREFLLRVSYIEIYNETIRDLLAPENTDLKIHEDRHRGIYVSPLKEEIVTNTAHVMNLLSRGEENRHVSTTDYNERSSRSHTIFQIVIESRERMPGSPAMASVNRHRSGAKPAVPVRLSSLNLIDLAGSEKASSSLDRRREGAYINKSLLTLGTVISKLTEDKIGHVPYRDSKLTRILQPSLQGNARVSVICTISPALNNFEESNNTLKFAQRIKKVVTNAHTTEILDDRALLQQYKTEIDELKSKLTELADKDTESTQLAAEKLRLEEELAKQQIVRVAYKERIDHLTKLILTSSSFNSNAIINSWNTQDRGDPSSAPRPKRLSIVPASPISPVDTQRLQDENRRLKASLESNEADSTRLREELLEKERQLVNSTFEIRTLKEQQQGEGGSWSAECELILSLRGELRDAEELNKQLQKTVEQQQIELAKLEIENMRYKMQSPVGDVEGIASKETVLRHELAQFKSKVSSLEQEVHEKNETIKHLLMRLSPSTRTYETQTDTQSPTAFTLDDMMSNIDISEISPPLPLRNIEPSNNAKILSDLISKNSTPKSTPQMERSQISSSIPPTPAFTPEKNVVLRLEQKLENERKMRTSLESSSTEKIAALDTELAIAKAELSVAQLLNAYSPVEPRIRSTSISSSVKSNTSGTPSRRPSEKVTLETTRTSSLEEYLKKQ